MGIDAILGARQFARPYANLDNSITGFSDLADRTQARKDKRRGRVSSALTSMADVQDRSTIRDVIQDKDYLGKESQDLVSQPYNQLAGQYKSDTLALDKAEFEAKKELTEYDPITGEALVNPDLSGIQTARKDLDTMYDSRLGEINKATQDRYAQDQGFLDTVTNPASAQLRLRDTLVGKGVSVQEADKLATASS